MPNPNLQKHTLNLRRGDYAALQAACIGQEITAGDLIRKLVSRYVDRLEQKTNDSELNSIDTSI